MPSDGKGKGGVSGHSLSFPLLSPGPFFVQGKGWDSPTMLVLRDFGPLILLVTFSKFTIYVQARIWRMFPFSCAGKAACACPPFFATIWTGGGGGGPFPSLPFPSSPSVPFSFVMARRCPPPHSPPHSRKRRKGESVRSEGKKGWQRCTFGREEVPFCQLRIRRDRCGREGARMFCFVVELEKSMRFGIRKLRYKGRPR